MPLIVATSVIGCQCTQGGLYNVWRILPTPLGTNEPTFPLFCLSGTIPFETAGKKLDDNSSDRGGDRVP